MSKIISYKCDLCGTEIPKNEKVTQISIILPSGAPFSADWCGYCTNKMITKMKDVAEKE